MTALRNIAVLRAVLRTGALLLAAIGLCAQTAPTLDLYRVNGTSEVAVTSAIEFPLTSTGAVADITLRIRTRDVRPVTLTDLYATSSAGVFSVENAKPRPEAISATSPYTFTLRFRPVDPGTFTGLLYFNDRRVGIAGASPEGVTVQVQRGAAFETLAQAVPVDFGSVERRLSTVRQFALVNRTQQPLIVVSAAIAPAGIFVIEGLATPVQLAPGATRTFAIRFAPQIAGIFRAQLDIGGRVFSLEGFATEPSAPTLSFEPATLRSGQQATVKIKLSEVSRANGTVRITLAGLESDSAVSLLPAGGRQLSVALREGAAELSVMLQTGTTAGKLKLTAEIAPQKAEAEYTIAPAAPAISTVGGGRAGGRVDVRVTGFDNTRGMRSAVFRFFDRAGSPISGAIPTDIAAAFERFYSTSTLGGAFALTASFPVTGDINSIGSVEVDLANGEGTASSVRQVF